MTADGVVQLSSSGNFCMPATQDNLRMWIARCKAEVPAEARTAQRARKQQEKIAEEQAEIAKQLAKEQAEMAKKVANEKWEIDQWRRSRRRWVGRGIMINPRSNDYDLALSRVKLKEARALLYEEIALRQRQGSSRPQFCEIVTIDGPMMIRCGDEPRQPHLYEETLTGISDPDVERTRWEETYTIGYQWEYGNIAAFMTVRADGVVEISSSGARIPATIENLRAVLDGVGP